MDTRVPVHRDKLEDVIEDITANLGRRIMQKGNLCHIGLHEMRGTVDEEWDEFKETVHNNDLGKAYRELSDIAVACWWGMASILAIEEENEKRKEER
jgi:hypothetical protein